MQLSSIWGVSHKKPNINLHHRIPNIPNVSTLYEIEIVKNRRLFPYAIIYFIAVGVIFWTSNKTGLLDIKAYYDQNDEIVEDKDLIYSASYYEAIEDLEKNYSGISLQFRRSDVYTLEYKKYDLDNLKADVMSEKVYFKTKFHIVPWVSLFLLLILGMYYFYQSLHAYFKETKFIKSN